MLCRTIVCVSYSKNIIDANSLARRQACRLSQEGENCGGAIVAGLDGRVNRPVALVPRLSRPNMEVWCTGRQRATGIVWAPLNTSSGSYFCFTPTRNGTKSWVGLFQYALT